MCLTLSAQRIEATTRAAEARDEDAEEQGNRDGHHDDNQPKVDFAMESGGGKFLVAIFHIRRAIIVAQASVSFGQQTGVIQRIFDIIAQISGNAALIK